MRTYLDAKAMAKALRAALADKGLTLSHSECLELVSKQIGFSEWNMLSAKIALEIGEREAPSMPTDISLQAPVPVMAIGSVVAAKEFYLDFLGFTVDWGWHEHSDRPLYAQVSRSGLSLHLSQRRAEDATTELFIRATGLHTLQAELAQRTHSYTLRNLQTPDDRREIQVSDPFGNLLRFSENNPPGTVNT